MCRLKLLNAMFVSAGIVILSSCSTVPGTINSTSERAVEYIKTQVPDSYLVKCLPRVLQSDKNKDGDPKAGVFIIQLNNSRLDECIMLHDNLVEYILKEESKMPDATKPDLKRQKQPDPTPSDKDQSK